MIRVLTTVGLLSAAAASAANAGPAQPLRLALNPATAPPLLNAAAFFTAGPHGFNNNQTLTPPLLSDLQRLGETALLGWDGVVGSSSDRPHATKTTSAALRTEPLTDMVTTPRLLGGWSPSKRCAKLKPIPGCVETPARTHCCTLHKAPAKCCAPVGWSDIAYRVADGGLAYRWELLWSRLDPMVNNSINPVVVLVSVYRNLRTQHALLLLPLPLPYCCFIAASVSQRLSIIREYNAFVSTRTGIAWFPLLSSLALPHPQDNVDYAFVKNASVGKYGQSRAPDPDSLAEYSTFIADLVARAVRRYGRPAAESFWWRVATEPNTGRGGTGQGVPAPQAEKISTYVNYYVAVSAAIRTVIPDAVVGPGNFASWYQMGMACNATTGKHANEGLTLIAPMLTGILAQGGSIGFLAMSYYGSDAGNVVGSDSRCARFAGCGYDPRQARVAGEGLRYLRGLAPALADVPLQVQEFAPMLNGYGRGPSFEPGAFGAAWTLASCVEFAAQGIDRVFHWTIGAGVGGYDPARSGVDAAGHVLFFGNAWVMAAARKLFGGSRTANVSLLQVAAAATGENPGNRRDKDTDMDMDTLARRMFTTEEVAVEVRVGGGDVCATTTASGVGGALSNGTGVGLLLSVFSQRKDCNESVTVSVAFECTACSSGSTNPQPHVQVMILNRTTSVYGQILQHAAGNEGWLTYDDGEVYPLSMMLTAEGLAGVKAQSEHWLAMQEAVFTVRDAEEVDDGVSVTCGSDGRCVLEVTGASPPSTYAVWVRGG